jgi:DNA repair protein SbcC/Rad50
MRPLRLLLDGFGSYRQVTDVDFSDVDFFALTGPTGAGKSTLIDGLCFALYGTVPRWGKENAIAHALAPAANACRVCLIFAAGGKRYAAVRALTRDKKGRVHTKEARLEVLDPAVPVTAPLAEVLAASAGCLAEGPDLVKAQVQQILGLSYEHFTQSVLLPQGQFAEFLQAKPADRQDLLVELLAFGVYTTVGQRARERAKLAADRMRNAQRERDELADVSPDGMARLTSQLSGLHRLEDIVAERLAVLASVTGQAGVAARDAGQVRAEVALLRALTAPDGIEGLTRRIAAADAHVASSAQQVAEAEHAENAAERARSALPDRVVFEAFRAAQHDLAELTAELSRRSAAAGTAHAAQTAAADGLSAAEAAAAQARAALAAAQDAHAAAHLASGLQPGDACPVCLQTVASAPRHPVPGDLSAARRAVSDKEKELTRARAAREVAAQASATAAGAVSGVRDRLDQVAAGLDGAPQAEEVDRVLAAITAADEAVSQARVTVRRRRTGLATAQRDRSALADEERAAWAAFRRARDSVVALGAPAADGGDLASAWAELAAWGAARQTSSGDRLAGLDAAAAELDRQVTDQTAAIASLLGEHQITGVTDVPGRALAAVTARRGQAEASLDAARRDAERATALDQRIRSYQEEEQVATMLGNLLRATSFERWLCGEALDALMAEASQTLMELSGGQYQLDRDERNDLVVIDFQDAFARRPVHTLSGGETFQASLALALALSRQVVGLSAGMRELNSMFLDEGFGTLDEDTLETVATTLERLAADSDRMVGVVTHVPALAERVPVRFVVGRSGGTSTIRKERA